MVNLTDIINNQQSWFNIQSDYDIDVQWKSLLTVNPNTLKKEKYQSLFYHFEFELRKNNSSNPKENYFIEMSIVKSDYPISDNEHRQMHLVANYYIDFNYGFHQYHDFVNFNEQNNHQKSFPSNLLLSFETLDSALSYYEFWKEKVLADHIEDLEEEEKLSTQILLWKNGVS